MKGISSMDIRSFHEPTRLISMVIEAEDVVVSMHPLSCPVEISKCVFYDSTLNIRDEGSTLGRFIFSPRAPVKVEGNLFLPGVGAGSVMGVA